MSSSRKTLYTRTPGEWDALLSPIRDLRVRVSVFRICWFDYISVGDYPEYGGDMLHADLGDFEPSPADIERELVRLGYPRTRAWKRAWCWAPEASRSDRSGRRPRG